MERTLTVLLVEDDPRACKELIERISECAEMTLIGVTNNATRAIELVADQLPDAMILDLELHQGSGNGLSVLQGLRSLAPAVMPYILITTNNSSALTYDAVRMLGADFIMSKHQTGYSEGGVVDFLKLMKTMIHTRRQLPVDAPAPETPQERERQLRRHISAELNLIGISPKAIGYQYLIDAILILYDQSVSNICALLSERYQKTDSSIERAMQNAINRTWHTSDIDDLLTHYTARITSEKGVPTVTEFMHYYANKIKNNTSV